MKDELTNQMVIPANYPELRIICWHRDPAQPIGEAEAFDLYERNWRYVNQSELSADEIALIDRLKNKYGKGVING